MLRFFTLCFALLPCLAFASAISFSRQIAPILVEQCVECHRADKVKGSYRLGTWMELQKPGDSEAPAITAGKLEKSELYRLIVVHDKEDRMPKKADPLPPDAIKLIKEWITAGAIFDGGDSQLNSPLETLFDEPQSPPAPKRYPHPLPVTALALSPDSQTLATGGYHEITFWNLQSGALKERIGGLPERILGLVWDANDALFVAGGTPGRRGELWHIHQNKSAPARRLLQTRDTLHAVAVAPDGRGLVTAGAGNSLHCITLPEGSIRWQIEAHADWVLDVAISPDGKHLATASRDRTARLINLETGEIDATFAAHSAPVTSLAFAADSKSVFSGSADGEIRNWNLAGENLKDSTLKPGRSAINALALADNLLIAALADGRVVPLDLSKRSALPPLVERKDQMQVVQVKRQDDQSPWLLIAGGHDGTIDRLYLPPLTQPKSQATKNEPVSTSESGPKQTAPQETPPVLPKPLQFTASPGW